MSKCVVDSETAANFLIFYFIILAMDVEHRICETFLLKIIGFTNLTAGGVFTADSTTRFIWLLFLLSACIPVTPIKYILIHRAGIDD